MMTTATATTASDRERKIAAALRRRRWMLGSLMSIAALTALLCLCDHFGLDGYRGEEQRRFDGRKFAVLSVDGPTTLTVDADGRRDQVVLLGLMPGPTTTAPEAVRILKERTAGQHVLLRLDGLTRRDRQGLLLAYVFVDETTSLNEQLIRLGLARVDRGASHSFAGAFANAEAAARRKTLGLWANGE